MEIETRIIPTINRPAIPAAPIPPDLISQQPVTIVLTAKEAGYYQEVCDAWESQEYSKEEMQELYPNISRSASCDWAIIGYTVQGHLTWEDILHQMATYSQQCRQALSIRDAAIDDMVRIAGEINQKIIGE